MLYHLVIFEKGVVCLSVLHAFISLFLGICCVVVFSSSGFFRRDVTDSSKHVTRYTAAMAKLICDLRFTKGLHSLEHNFQA